MSIYIGGGFAGRGWRFGRDSKEGEAARVSGAPMGVGVGLGRVANGVVLELEHIGDEIAFLVGGEF